MPSKRLIKLGSGILAVLIGLVFWRVPAPAEAAADINLVLHDQVVVSDVAPLIESGRVLVPIRVIAEGLGYQVIWEPSRSTVSITGPGVTVEMAAGAATAMVSGRQVQLDVGSRIVDGRVLVPLRFIGEAMGAEVVWEHSARTVRVKAVPGGLTGGKTIAAGRNFDLSDVLFGVHAEAIEKEWGRPQRRDAGLYGFEWWVYQPQAGQYLRFGFRDQRLVAAYALGRHWSYGAVSRTSTPQQAVASLGIPSQTQIDWMNGRVTFDCSAGDPGGHGRLPLLWDGDQVVMIYTDIFDQRVDAALVMDKQAFMTTNPVRIYEGCVIRYTSSLTFPVKVELSGDLLKAAEAGEARALNDLVNVQRVLRGIAALPTNETAAQAAAVHARDMADHGYFAHQSPRTGSPTDRLHAAGQNACQAGENIARGYEDAPAAHHALMNSAGHRKSILDPLFQSFGSAVADEHYAETYVFCP